MHRLQPTLKEYSWGSRSAIQSLTGLGRAGEPLAEIWYGAHPSGPSHLDDGGTLEELIRADNVSVLGEEVSERFDGALPFLVKFIAPGQAVSLQVHPNQARARAGYSAELHDPAGERMFVDPRHKPEQIFALTAFEGLVGLLPLDEALQALDMFDHPVARAARAELSTHGTSGIASALATLARASTTDVHEVVAQARTLADHGSVPAQTLLALAEQYPGDPGVAVSLMLRKVHLDPGDSVMVASGVPHAYMSGLALEVMANSDNVFRLGLTSKRVDIEESIANVLTDPANVSRPHDPDGPGARVSEEFHLRVHDLRSGEVAIAGGGPRIVVGLRGESTISDGVRSVPLFPGAAAFLPHRTEANADGSGSLAVISVPNVVGPR
ncbi:MULTISPECIES: mannose-6-phosphate isomerase, class I [unclassified Microbacterium]|uniref:mannose-6-phosphate isomerase, class I n=1 Tax=unclassified Microbacterium TaxID=2609290 RepID=UPI0012FDDB26|nr:MULTISPECIES: mannose-6-phosphate isomerase, class I [unclassified Microbacterium]